MSKAKSLYLIPVFLFFALLTWWASDVPFFWDGIMQASRPAFWFYDNTFLKFFLPPHVDAGHPPFLGIYLALAWHIFGKTLLVSHLAMLPFAFGIIWYLHKIVNYFFSTNYNWLIVILALSDATLLAQTIHMGPDLLLTCFFLMAVYALLNQKNKLFGFAMVPIVLISVRGILLITVLFIVYLLFHKNKNWVRRVLPFLPAGLLGFAYYYFHFQATGWWISTPVEGWSAHRGLNSFGGMLKNIIIYDWRYLDFGRIGVWVIIFYTFLKKSDLKIKSDGKLSIIIGLTLTFFLLHALFFIPLNNPISHRYFLPVFPLIVLLAAYLLVNWSGFANHIKKYILAGLVLLQLAGNFIIYPAKVAQGWDASLAALPYFELREQMIDFIADNDIDFKEVGTAFPNYGAMEFLELNGVYVGFHQIDFENEKYIFYSNVFNDFSDQQIDNLQSEWELMKEYRKNRITVALFRRPEK